MVVNGVLFPNKPQIWSHAFPYMCIFTLKRDTEVILRKQRKPFLLMSKITPIYFCQSCVTCFPQSIDPSKRKVENIYIKKA